MPVTCSNLDVAAPLTLACLCAAWCQTCTDYRLTFEALVAQAPGLRLAWVDIEDHADALEAFGTVPDVDNFPTLLLMRGEQPVFYGTVLPHAAVAQRLLAQAQALPVLHEAEVQHLAQAVAELRRSGALS